MLSISSLYMLSLCISLSQGAHTDNRRRTLMLEPPSLLLRWLASYFSPNNYEFSISALAMPQGREAVFDYIDGGDAPSLLRIFLETSHLARLLLRTSHGISTDSWLKGMLMRRLCWSSKLMDHLLLLNMVVHCCRFMHHCRFLATLSVYECG